MYLILSINHLPAHVIRFIPPEQNIPAECVICSLLREKGIPKGAGPLYDISSQLHESDHAFFTPTRTKRFHSSKIQLPFLCRESGRHPLSGSLFRRHVDTLRKAYATGSPLFQPPRLMCLPCTIKAGINLLFASCLSSQMFVCGSQSKVWHFLIDHYHARQDTPDVALVNRRCSSTSFRACLFMVLARSRPVHIQDHRVVAGYCWHGAHSHLFCSERRG